MESNIEQARREEARWRVLVGLNAGRPYPVSESVLFRLLHDVNLPISPHDLRVELDYLEERGLLKIGGRDSATWSAELTRYGIDIVEYTIDCDPGIARPPKHW